MSNVGNNIRNQRLERGMTQDELATKIFTTRQTISNYETGKTKPDYTMLGRIADALEVNADLLIYGDKDRKKIFRLWSYAIITCFVYFLALSILKNSTVFGDYSMNRYVVYEFAYTLVIVPAICIALGLLAVKFYDVYMRKDTFRYIGHSKTICRIFMVILIIWFVFAIINAFILYDALSDTVKNQYGGPMQLGIYINSFYYKVVYIPLQKLPVLNAVFVAIGGFLSACFNNVLKEE